MHKAPSNFKKQEATILYTLPVAAPETAILSLSNIKLSFLAFKLSLLQVA